MVRRIYMDAACKMNYASFYIHGLKELFGEKALFSKSHFQNLGERTQCFLFVVEYESEILKIAVDFHDFRKLELEMLGWADIYAKINLNDLSFEPLELLSASDCDRLKNKIVSIPPSFGIRIFTLSQTVTHIFHLLFNFWRSKYLKLYIFDTLRMYVKRLPISSYKPAKSKGDYIFFIASIWDKSTDFINITRAYFIRSCKQLKRINFEGGFVNIGYECKYIDDLEILMYRNKKVPLKQFIEKTKKSALVFNNPSVNHCHGWKLAEFLCMGKAIISVPLSNKLPVDLIHEKNVYFTENTQESISKSIEELLDNTELIETLEKNAQIYWQKYGSPEAVINKLLESKSNAQQF
ncbi:glycosyltransferase [Halpernia frigidisoli]|uniref:Glycosyltransferase n=1 Tax=Halpernia frigidisoli TaxID=1125876 RepID=A0A1I3FE95_9FLAO|nr:glycosyltransferase [Halpernia frigidisoli]SFI09516.1 hypothetical protein SAMN05443292_1323 [Halpernia frigidisoli]